MITIYLKQYNKIIRNADTKLFDELGYDDILWIDMLLPTIKEQKAVENFMEISLQTKQQVEEIESTSKYSENENAIISNSNFFVPTGDTFIVEPVSFIISNEGVLVSVRSAEFRTFRETEKRLQMNYRSYSTGYHLFISLLEVRIDFDADLVELIAKQVAALSKDINSEDSIDKAVLHRISALQESTMSLRENIFDRQRVLSGILRSERFPNDIYPRLQLMIKDVNSLINHADFSFQRLDYIQDAALGLINIEQNEDRQNFLRGRGDLHARDAHCVDLWHELQIHARAGLDADARKRLEHPLGYIFAIGLMIFCSALTIWYFKYKSGCNTTGRSAVLVIGTAGVPVVFRWFLAGMLPAFHAWYFIPASSFFPSLLSAPVPFSVSGGSLFSPFRPFRFPPRASVFRRSPFHAFPLRFSLLSERKRMWPFPANFVYLQAISCVHARKTCKTDCHLRHQYHCRKVPELSAHALLYPHFRAGDLWYRHGYLRPDPAGAHAADDGHGVELFPLFGQGRGGGR